MAHDVFKWLEAMLSYSEITMAQSAWGSMDKGDGAMWDLVSPAEEDWDYRGQ